MTLKEWREEIESSCRFTLEHEGKPYAVVVAEWGIHRAIGVAKCNPRDKYDPQRGLQIAKGRAVKDLAQRMAREEQRTVKWVAA